MGSYSTSEFRDSLLKKGFKEGENHHHMYRFYVDGKKTNIQTKASHSEKDYDDHMLKQRKQQLGLQNKQQYIDFVKCPMGYDEYKSILLTTGRVRLAEPHLHHEGNL
ncbi:MAG: hypothetical protein AB2L14_25140 [Candidatus Xenobiia bacterium LiM19]